MFIPHPKQLSGEHFRRDVILNPNKSNLTVALAYTIQREPKGPRVQREEDEEIDRANVTKDRETE